MCDVTFDVPSKNTREREREREGEREGERGERGERGESEVDRVGLCLCLNGLCVRVSYVSSACRVRVLKQWNAF